MRITVFGVVGNVGRRVVAEGLSRGHEVTAVVRNPAYVPQLPGGVRAHVGNAGKVEDVAKLSAGQDVVISATRPAPGSEHELPMTAKALLAGVARDGRAAAGLYVVGARVARSATRWRVPSLHAAPILLAASLAPDCHLECCASMKVW